MKKNLIYIVTGLVVIAIIVLVVTGNNSKNKKADQRITLGRQDKIPYGAYTAFKNLGYIFPGANILINKHAPGSWDSLSSKESGQALIILTGQFNADENELKKMIEFISMGNDVFVSARNISWYAKEIMNCSVNSFDLDEFDDGKKDSLHLFLDRPPYQQKEGFYYSGKTLDANFVGIDEGLTEILGEDEKGRPDFIRLRAGKGNLFVHLAPLAFSNHFLLYKDNIGYYEKILSVIPKDVKKLVWDEYYLNKKFVSEPSKKHGWFTVLMQFPALKAALLTAIFALLIYVLLEMRRKQRYIPVVERPRNDSLDFVRTIGRLYFDKGDHKNLSRKMSAYFLEHVRNKYKIPTSSLDEDFISNLQFKSGVQESGIRAIVSFIGHAEVAEEISQKQLAEFHKQLELFYKKT